MKDFEIQEVGRHLAAADGWLRRTYQTKCTQDLDAFCAQVENLRNAAYCLKQQQAQHDQQWRKQLDDAAKKICAGSY